MVQKQVAWNSGAGYIKLTYTGSGNGSIIVDSDENNLGTARSQVVTVHTVDGTKSVNLTVRQGANPFPVGKVQDFSYTGDYEEIELPAGTYKLQCWGAQGGTNSTDSTYGITAKAGGKGGYSEGVLTLSQKTVIRAYVGGQGTSSSGGFNGGGNTTESSQYNSGGEFGISKMAGGGGATDFRLSDGSLLSRMIVAGGGSGGSMAYKKVTTQVWEKIGSLDFSGSAGVFNGYNYTIAKFKSGSHHYSQCRFETGVNPIANGTKVKAVFNGNTYSGLIWIIWSDGTQVINETTNTTIEFTQVSPSNISNYLLRYQVETDTTVFYTGTVDLYKEATSIDESTYGLDGYIGGGIRSGAYDTPEVAHQTAAGTNGSFGQGANQTARNYRYCGAGGGGGLYGGGGGEKSDSVMLYAVRSGGGSGFVNTAESAGNRPSGYTGLQLDSGETLAGNKSFPSTNGGTEVGHSGHGYARLTRLS
jgi:hypothetical protein